MELVNWTLLVDSYVAGQNSSHHNVAMWWKTDIATGTATMSYDSLYNGSRIILHLSPPGMQSAFSPEDGDIRTNYGKASSVISMTLGYSFKPHVHNSSTSKSTQWLSGITRDKITNVRLCTRQPHLCYKQLAGHRGQFCANTLSFYHHQ